jgi:SAM-dependent methyltransferase
MTSHLPDTVEPGVYRAFAPDLAGLDDAALLAHYAAFGQSEGRQANRLATRADFIGLIPTDASALEIGPFYSPLLAGPNAYFFDVLSQTALIARARSLGVENPNVPVIDYISPTGDLAVIDRTFQSVISSHCIEHQPDLVAHLQQVTRLLQTGGRYFLLIPDKRYCFDTFIAETTIAEVLEAHHSQRKTHLLKSVIEHRAMTTHNDHVRHWQGDHGNRTDNQDARIAAALKEYQEAAGGYIDVHAWYFTPGNIADILGTLRRLGYIGLDVERVYPTRQSSNEFWMVLRKV